jgi:hypothetical protein
MHRGSRGLVAERGCRAAPGGVFSVREAAGEPFVRFQFGSARGRGGPGGSPARSGGRGRVHVAYTRERTVATDRARTKDIGVTLGADKEQMAASAGPRTEGPEAAHESHGSKEKVPDGGRQRTMKTLYTERSGLRIGEGYTRYR